MMSLSPRIARLRRGFTLVELLVVVLILAILMAVALPLYLSSVKDSSKKTCRANMQSIANAAQAWKVRTRGDFATLTDTTPLLDDLGAVPQSPDGGLYVIIHGGDASVDGTGAAVTVPAGGIGVKNVDCGAFIPGVTTN